VIAVARWLVAATVAAAASTPATWSDPSTVVPVDGEADAEPLLFVGDSLCVGARDHGGGLTGALRGARWDPELVCGTGEGLEWGLAQVTELERVPATVVIALGTNPSAREPGFADLVVDLRSQLVARGAERILWVDFADRRGTYTDKNLVLHDIARHEGDGIVRWSVLAAAHPEWFRSDGIHYREEGMRRWSRRIADETTRLRLGPAPSMDDEIAAVVLSSW